VSIVIASRFSSNQTALREEFPAQRYGLAQQSAQAKYRESLLH
jgi:hypothetical protein